MPEQEQPKFISESEPSEGFGTFPNGSAGFRNVPKDSESFRNIRNLSERKESHSLTVREAARLFEEAAVARTERSIVNWCQPNRMGVARLDCYFDPNERKYFISPQSIAMAISEEKAKAAKEKPEEVRSEPVADIPEHSERPQDKSQHRNFEIEPDEIKLLKQELLDLKITNKGKDYFIEQLQRERDGFNAERQGYVEKLMGFNRQVGELETKLLQLEQPSGRRLEVRTDGDSTESNLANR